MRSHPSQRHCSRKSPRRSPLNPPKLLRCRQHRLGFDRDELASPAGPRPQRTRRLRARQAAAASMPRSHRPPAARRRRASSPLWQATPCARLHAAAMHWLDHRPGCNPGCSADCGSLGKAAHRRPPRRGRQGLPAGRAAHRDLSEIGSCRRPARRTTVRPRPGPSARRGQPPRAVGGGRPRSETSSSPTRAQCLPLSCQASCRRCEVSRALLEPPTCPRASAIPEHRRKTCRTRSSAH
mmetsp:Transcript_31033/g.89683  ORF Transcript_31033/g.89683 Transcript_31033/m.89683 type:complete len:238 (-) Transcript_31033:1544-2257(-)